MQVRATKWANALKKSEDADQPLQQQLVGIPTAEISIEDCILTTLTSGAPPPSS